MTTGTKSIIFGVHQFIWHPMTVLMAWVSLYGRPTWREVVCIIIHDWGYWGSPDMDGERGEAHPELGATLAAILFDNEHYDLCLLHSRHYARNVDREPSRLCWADKLSLIYDPWWFYLPRAWASRELFEYRVMAVGYVGLGETHRTWFKWVKARLVKLARDKKGDAVPYANPEKKDKPWLYMEGRDK